MSEHAVFEMPRHGAREHGALDVAADLRDRLERVVMGDAGDVLLDDRPASSSAVTWPAVAPMTWTPLSSARRYGSAPAKAGRNEWWVLITGASTQAAEDLHAAGEDDTSNRPAR